MAKGLIGTRRDCCEQQVQMDKDLQVKTEATEAMKQRRNKTLFPPVLICKIHNLCVQKKNKIKQECQL